MHTMRTCRGWRDLLIDNKKWALVKELFCSAAMLGLAGCSGAVAGDVTASPVSAAAASLASGLPQESARAMSVGACAPAPAPTRARGPAPPPAPPPPPAAATRGIERVAMHGEDVNFQADRGIDEVPADRGAHWGMPVKAIDDTASTSGWPAISYDFSTPEAGPERSPPGRRVLPFPAPSKTVSGDDHGGAAGTFAHCDRPMAEKNRAASGRASVPMTVRPGGMPWPRRRET
jgi:hypothetical protein